MIALDVNIKVNGKTNMKWAIEAHVQDAAERQKIIMSNLEHLIENGLIAMECCHGYDDWHDHIKDDPNWDNVWVSIEDLWIICQYVIYTWCPMRCEECKGIDCVDCKYENSDVCNDCKRQWIHKDDKFELNLYWKGEYEAICKQEGYGKVNMMAEWQGELVRCKDCKHQEHCHETIAHTRLHDGFKEYWSEPIEWCSRGERKGGENE